MAYVWRVECMSMTMNGTCICRVHSYPYHTLQPGVMHNPAVCLACLLPAIGSSPPPQLLRDE